MPFNEIKLIPGVDTTKTPTLNEAGVSVSQLIRYREGLVQKYGGWSKYYPFSLDGVPRDLHSWKDLNGDNHLSVGTTVELDLITNGTLVDITPQTYTSDYTPADFTTTMGSTTVTVADPNIANVTVLDTVYFNTPVAIDGIILSGAYPITSILGTTQYTIEAATAGVAGVASGGAIPSFTTTASSPTVSVTLAAHGLAVGNQVYFPIATSGDGVTIQGLYTVNTITSVDIFTITANTSASAGTTFNMNGGDVELLYYINLGPPAPGVGFGVGAFGAGGFGSGTVPSAQTGTPITATDWTSDNWGQVGVWCPKGGGVYVYDPVGGYTNAGLVSTAPVFNGGLFVSTSQRILVCWASTQSADIGTYQDPLLVRWSDAEDYTQFTPLETNQAGSFQIPFGNELRAGIATPNQNLLWTDLDCWAMVYAGTPLIYTFNRIGAGAGAVGSHAVQTLRNGVYWMGANNFYVYAGGSVSVIPCPVWDAVFQNLNTSYAHNVRAMPNTAFDEVGWLYPSAASTSGECDSYVKFNVTEQGAPWDIGSLPRSAWIDEGILGPPLSATPSGVLYQQETTNDADGSPLGASFTTGYSVIGDGEQFAFVDWVLPDMRWGTYGTTGASVSITFNVVDYPNATPRTYGPYTMTSGTPYIPVRFRGRQVSATIASSDLGSFWRLGGIRYRWSPAGRR